MNELLKINYDKIKLDNGLEVILYPQKNVPLAAVNIWYKVGSANEVKGKTGLAHLFEHMMFQGSENVPKEKHFHYIQEAGGSLNGSTSTDRTNYYETVPSNFLEMALWLESDRMGFFLPALSQKKLDNQKDVVANERRQRYDNQPYGRAWELIFSNLFNQGHPYHHPTIGWMEDIKGYSLEDVRSFFSTYYSPNNASLVVAGDFDNGKAVKLIEEYFGDIQPAEKIPDVKFEKTPLEKNKHIVHKDNVQLPKIFLAWQTVPMFEPMDAALDILSEILTGSKGSLLHKSLVFDKQISLDAGSFQYSGAYDGMYIITSTARPGISAETLYNEIMEILGKISSEGISSDEIKKARNKVKASFIYSLQNISRLADHINNYNVNLGEPDSLNFDLDRYEKISEKDVHEAARLLLKGSRLRLDIVPENGETK